MASSVPQMMWQPWGEEVCRLNCEGYGAGAIADKLGKNVLDVIAMMELPEYKARLADKQTRIDNLFMERLVNLWDLTEQMVEVAKVTAQSYLDKLAEGTPEKELRSLRSDALKVMSDVLDRVGLRAPERVEQKITSRSETVDATPLATYEKRLELVREYKEAGLPLPDGLCKVDLDG